MERRAGDDGKRDCSSPPEFYPSPSRLSQRSSVIPWPSQPPNYQPSSWGRESSYTGLYFRLWKWQQAGRYWRKSNQQTCSQATDWSVILTETQQRMASCMTSPQRVLYLGELCVMRWRVYDNCFYKTPPKKCGSWLAEGHACITRSRGLSRLTWHV